ncbi:MAG: capsule biosynthesis protein CapA, partial [Roseobacter sp.]
MTQPPPAPQRVFLFLQGPHGPFFSQLARQLQNAGAETWRVGFNAGDRAFWSQRATYIPYRKSPEHWAATLQDILANKRVTDLVLYGDTRPIHAQAAELAREKSLRLHVFEEGYLRPYWVTYELGGSNGHSRLMDLSVARIKSLRQSRQFDPPVPPGHWGDMRQHIFYGAAYHWCVLALNRSYPHFRPHRSLNV